MSLRAFLEDIKEIFSFALGGAGLLALLITNKKALPPPSSLIAITSSVLIALGSIYAYYFSKKFRKVHTRTRITLISMGVVVFFGAVYVAMCTQFLYWIPGDSEAIVLGCGWSDHAKMVLSDYLISPNDQGCPGEYINMLKAAEYEAPAIWTSSSVRLLNFILNIVWHILILGCSMSVGMIVSMLSARNGSNAA